MIFEDMTNIDFAQKEKKDEYEYSHKEIKHNDYITKHLNYF